MIELRWVKKVHGIEGYSMTLQSRTVGNGLRYEGNVCVGMEKCYSEWKDVPIEEGRLPPPQEDLAGNRYVETRTSYGIDAAKSPHSQEKP